MLQFNFHLHTYLYTCESIFILNIRVRKSVCKIFIDSKFNVSGTYMSKFVHLTDEPICRAAGLPRWQEW